MGPCTEHLMEEEEQLQAKDYKTLGDQQPSGYRVNRLFTDSADEDLCIMAESESEYAQEKEFKIDRLHALSKVILSEDRLYSLDLQGNIYIINLEQEKIEKRMMKE